MENINYNIKKIFVKKSKLLNKDIIPTKENKRIMSWKDIIWLWLGMAAQMGVFMLGASFVGKLTIFESLLSIFLGNLGAAIILSLIGDIGIEHGINFPTYIRAPFGYYGSYLPMIIRSIAGICWFGIQTYFAATAIDLIIKHFFKFSNIPLWFLIFGIIQIIITAKGIKWINWVENIAAPSLLILCFYIIYVLISKSSLNYIFSYPVTQKLPFWSAVTINLSYWSTVSINIPDFSRFMKNINGSKKFLTRNFHSMLGQAIGAPLGMIIFASVGMISHIVTGYGNPVEAIYTTLPTAFLILIGLTIVILAQLSTNIAANLFAPGNILNSIFSPKINFSTAVIIAGSFGLLTFPWILINFFLTYLPTIGALLSPVAGIMLSDYYLIRRRNLSIKDLFSFGEYKYLKGYNPAAIITYLISIIFGLRFLKYSWLISLPISLLLYYLLMKFYILKRYKQKEIENDSQEKFLGSSENIEYEIEIEN